MFAVLSQNRSKHGWTQTTPFHGGNWGSNPHGDAISFPPFLMHGVSRVT
jgi:hypothetical protein